MKIIRKSSFLFCPLIPLVSFNWGLAIAGPENPRKLTRKFQKIDPGFFLLFKYLMIVYGQPPLPSWIRPVLGPNGYLVVDRPLWSLRSKKPNCKSLIKTTSLWKKYCYIYILVVYSKEEKISPVSSPRGKLPTKPSSLHTSTIIVCSATWRPTIKLKQSYQPMCMLTYTKPNWQQTKSFLIFIIII